LGHWTEALVLHEIRELHAQDEDLRYTSVKRRRHSLFWAAKQLFGSYVNAVREAGVDYWEMSHETCASKRSGHWRILAAPEPLMR
jgi:hypothetical protein